MEGNELIVDGLSRFEAVFSPYQDAFVIIGGAAFTSSRRVGRARRASY